ncbi:MAG: hypothetical protein CMN72_14945 [Sphingomonas sp.]|nr:hypothetical protein [Sphingomonas sp.]
MSTPLRVRPATRVTPFTHSSGCGMAKTGEGIEALERTLPGYARYPNFGGVLMIWRGRADRQRCWRAMTWRPASGRAHMFFFPTCTTTLT